MTCQKLHIQSLFNLAVEGTKEKGTSFSQSFDRAKFVTLSFLWILIFSSIFLQKLWTNKRAQLFMHFHDTIIPLHPHSYAKFVLGPCGCMFYLVHSKLNFVQLIYIKYATIALSSFRFGRGKRHLSLQGLSFIQPNIYFLNFT